MFELLKNIDYIIFHFINETLANTVFDAVLPILRKMEVWFPLYILIIYFIYKKEGTKHAAIFFFGAVLLIFISDFAIANQFKHYYQRLRPCNNASMHARVLVNCGSGFSFISAHACNHFALALYISFFLKKYFPKIIFYALLWAASIAFSQVYVGVHYPSDVAVGAVIGSVMAIFYGSLYKNIAHIKWSQSKNSNIK